MAVFAPYMWVFFTLSNILSYFIFAKLLLHQVKCKVYYFYLSWNTVFKVIVYTIFSVSVMTFFNVEHFFAPNVWVFFPFHEIFCLFYFLTVSHVLGKMQSVLLLLVMEYVKKIWIYKTGLMGSGKKCFFLKVYGK